MKTNDFILGKINRGELVTAEHLISSLSLRDENLKAYWKQKYDELSATSIKEVQ